MSQSKTNGLNHIAFIMDGNGRWAKKRHKKREYGHIRGAEVFRKIVRHCADLDIDAVTVYAFSTENWKRPKSEVNAIMSLCRKYIDEALTSDAEASVVFLGDKSAFDAKMRSEMEKLEAKTAHYRKKICIAFNYGGHAEIVDAVNALIAGGKTHITEEDITGAIYSGIVPPPDIIVRTGGEYRLSNFLLWQSAYSELFFTETLWPDFTSDELDGIIEEFGKRKRRFGGV